MAGISEASFYRWIEEDESFKSRVEANILEYKHTLVRNVTTCAEKDGRLALEVLKRRYPQEWGNNEYVGRSHEELETERKNVRELLEKILVQEEESVIPV